LKNHPNHANNPKGVFMKKYSVSLAMPVLALVFGLTFVSCWTTPKVDEPTQFEGRWLDQTAVNEVGYSDLSYTFAGDTFVLRIKNDQGYVVDYTYAGTFKYTANRIRFTSGKETWTQEYTLAGNEFNLMFNRTGSGGRGPVAGTFVKQ
jgi:hypothetical protein